MKRLAALLALLALSLATACGVNASRVATQVAAATVTTAASIALDAALCGDDCAPVCEEESEEIDPNEPPERLLEDHRYDPYDESRIAEGRPVPSYTPDEDVFGPRLDD